MLDSNGADLTDHSTIPYRGKKIDDNGLTYPYHTANPYQSFCEYLKTNIIIKATRPQLVYFNHLSPRPPLQPLSR